MTPSNVPSGDDALPVETPEVVLPELSFEERVHIFWVKHGPVVIGLCLAILFGILGYGIWQYFQGQRDLSLQKEYAAAVTDDQLAAFAAAHPSHVLGAAANVRLGDTAVTSGKPDVAIADYAKALAVVKSGPLASRVRLGSAMSKVLAGKIPEGTAELRRIADDSTEFKAIRAEAIFHLATMASDSGLPSEVQKYSTQLLQVDPQSPWLQRLLALQPIPAPAPVIAPGTPLVPAAAVPASTEPKK